MTEPELLDKIVGFLGGRVAEEIIFGEVSTGHITISNVQLALPVKWSLNMV